MRARVLERRKLPPRKNVEQEPDKLYVLGLFGPKAEVLRTAVHNHRDYLSKSTKGRCVFVVPGDPRHADDPFRKMVSEMGIKSEEEISWQTRCMQFGDAETARMNLCFEVAELLDLEWDDLPCLVYTTTRSSGKRSTFPLPLKWWLRPELADSLVGRMIEVLAEDRVARMLERAAKRQINSLDLIEKGFRTLEDGVSWTEAYGLEPTDVTVLSFFQGRPDERIKTAEVARRLDLPGGTVRKTLSKLVKMGLLQNEKRRGYRVTSLGMRLRF